MVLAGCIPERKRVDARLRGRGFYRSCAAAPNDGFGPGTAPPSGLVQRGVINAAFGGNVAVTPINTN